MVSITSETFFFVNSLLTKLNLNRILELRTLGGQNDRQNQSVTHVGSWSSNYNSWKEFKKVNKYLLIKYEDLVSKPEETFLSILDFIHQLSNSKF